MLRASRQEFKIFVIGDRSVYEQVPEYLWFSNHYAAPIRFDVPVIRVLYRVMNGVDFSWFTVEEDSIAYPNLLAGLVEERHSEIQLYRRSTPVPCAPSPMLMVDE